MNGMMTMTTWEKITVEEYQEIIAENGGIYKLTVFGAYTELEGYVKINMTGIAREDDVYTEWGRRDDDEPLVSSRRQGHGHENSRWTFRKNTDKVWGGE